MAMDMNDAQDILQEQMKSILTDMMKQEFKDTVPTREELNERTQETVNYLQDDYGVSMNSEYSIRYIETIIPFQMEGDIALCPECHKDMELMCQCDEVDEYEDDEDDESEDDYHICTECHDPDCEGCND